MEGELSSPFEHFLRREVTLLGAWNSFSAPFPGAEWRTTIDKLASGELAWEFMVTHDRPIDRVPETMQMLGERSEFSSKIIFRPS